MNIAGRRRAKSTYASSTFVMSRFGPSAAAVRTAVRSCRPFRDRGEEAAVRRGPSPRRFVRDTSPPCARAEADVRRTGFLEQVDACSHEC